MEELILVGKSLTNAQQIFRCLEKGGFSCRMTRMPSEIRDRGCGYVIRVRWDDKTSCFLRLQQCNLTVKRIFQKDQAGQYSEVKF